jgi:DNA-binding response OmpR family regulator
VWVVEDDARIQKLMASALDAAGYQVEVAADARAALAMMERIAAPRVLVTDIVMPGMRGTELALRMREQFSELRVLFISGYSEGEIGDWRSGEKGVRFLAKPFRPSELVAAVAELLGR